MDERGRGGEMRGEKEEKEFLNTLKAGFSLMASSISAVLSFNSLSLALCSLVLTLVPKLL